MVLLKTLSGILSLRSLCFVVYQYVHLRSRLTRPRPEVFFVGVDLWSSPPSPPPQVPWTRSRTRTGLFALGTTVRSLHVPVSNITPLIPDET